METKTHFNYPKRHLTQLKNRINDSINDYSNINRSINHNSFQFSFDLNLLSNEIEEVNGIEEILGHSDKSLSLHSFCELIHYEDSFFIFKNIKKILKNIYNYDPNLKHNISFLITLRIKHNSGQYIHLLCKTSVSEIIDGYITKLTNVFIDISGLNLRPFSSIKLNMANNQGFSDSHLSSDFVSEYIDLFSKREISVMRLAAEGKISREIAEILGISVKTVDTHRRNIIRKSDSKNLIEVISVLKEAKVI